MEMTWTRLLKMHYPRVTWLRTEDDAEAAISEIRHTIRHNPPGPEELCAAIRWLAGPEGRQEHAPSLRDLIRAIFIMRKNAREEAQGYDAGLTHNLDAYNRTVCRELAAAADHGARWDILCDPPKHAGLPARPERYDPAEIFEWAARRWSDFGDAAMVIKRAMQAESQRILGGVVAALEAGR